MQIPILRRGSSPLNFKVVGGETEPANPVENTVWINTPNEITSWIFSKTEPETPMEGMVCIFVDSNGYTNFNALKNNGIMVCPVGASQYINGLWEDREVKTYYNDEWHVAILYMYNSGNEFTNITGGFTTSSLKIASNIGTKTPTITRGTDRITVSLTTANNGVGGSMRTINKIDLTPYSKLVMNCDLNIAGGAAALAISDDNSAFDASSTAWDVKRSIFEVDISNITGSYYVYVSVAAYDNTTKSVTVYSLYAE